MQFLKCSLIALAALCIYGCGGGSSEPSMEPEAEAEYKETYDAEQAKAAEEAAKAYQR